MDERGAAHARRLAWSTAIFSLATGRLAHRAASSARSSPPYYFGAAGKINAFTVAFQVPNLVRSLVADAALSSAFVPVFSELLEKGERKRAWRVASTLFWLMLLGLGALTALLIIFAPLIIRPFGDPGGDPQLAIGLSRVLFPIVTLLGISGVIVGILNSYEQFSVPAITPIFWNLAIIVGLVIGVPRAHTINAQLYVYAISIVIGTVIQVLLPVPWLRGLDGRLQFLIDWRDPAVRRVFVLMLPVTIGLGLINFNLVVDSIFASRLIDPELAPTAIDKAFRLYMLPQGMFSVAVATVLFPSLSRFAARGDMDGFRDRVGVGLRQIAFLLIPASVVSAVLAEPIVRLVYQRGAVRARPDPGGRRRARRVLARAHVQRVDADAEPRLLQPAVALDPDLGRARQPRPERGARRRLLPGRHLGDRRSSTSLVNIAGTAVLLWLLQRRLARHRPAAHRAGVRADLARFCVVAGVVYGVWAGLDRTLGHGIGAQIGASGLRSCSAPSRTWSAAASSECTSSRRCGRFAAARNLMIEFLPLAKRDLPLVREWLAQEHVRPWWRDPPGSRAGYEAAIDGDDLTDLYLIQLDGRSVGMIPWVGVPHRLMRLDRETLEALSPPLRSTPMDQARIRNFSIIAHIDHGKSTLADRILELTETVTGREMRAQVLDSMELERERGITIKAQAVRVAWKGHQLNLIDTPGHVDFTYEVSRSLQACEGALLVVDASQGVEAQTVANAYLAIENDLEIVPVREQDRPPAGRPGRRRRGDRGARRRERRARPAHLGEDRARGSRRCSTRSSSGSRRRRATRDAPPRALIFDSSYDQYRGVVAFVRVVDGSFAPREGAARDGAGNALRGGGGRLLLADDARGRVARRGRGRLRHHRPQGRQPAARRRHAHARSGSRRPSRCPATRTSSRWSSPGSSRPTPTTTRSCATRSRS